MENNRVTPLRPHPCLAHIFSHGFLIQLLSWKCKFRLKITPLSRLELLIRSHSVGPQTPFPAVLALPISFPTPTRLLPFSGPWKLISRLTSRLHQPFNSRKCTTCILTTIDIKEERRSESNPTVPNNCALLSLTSPRPLPPLSPFLSPTYSMLFSFKVCFCSGPRPSLP